MSASEKRFIIAAAWGVGMVFVLAVLVGVGASSLAVPVVALVVSVAFVVLTVVATKIQTAPASVKAMGDGFARHPAVFVGWFGVLFLGGIMGIAANRAQAQAQRDTQELCRSRIQEIRAVKDPTFGEAARLAERAREGRRACEAGGLPEDGEALAAVAAEIDRQIAAQRQAQASTREAETPTTATTAALDPTRCPRGKVVIDFKTKKTINCTGPAKDTGSAAASDAVDDDADVKTRCRELEKWDGLTFIRCSALPSGHLGVDIVLTNSAWEFLGENGRQKMFAMAALESFKEHWRTFHGWKGREPASHQVHLWRAGGMTPETPVATISAGGLYVGD